MIFLFYVYLFAVDLVFCRDHQIYEYNNVKVINTAENDTTIRCGHPFNGLDNFTLPVRKLPVKNDIKFLGCIMPHNFNISKFMDDLEIPVNKLTFQQSYAITKHNIIGLKSLRHLCILSGTDNLLSDLLENVPDLEQLSMDFIDDIPDNFFKYSTKLKKLEILNSNLQTLKKEKFDGLINLSLLKLNFNFDAIDVEDNIFDSLTSLKLLEISYKTLINLPGGSLRNLTKLESVNIFFDNADLNAVSYYNHYQLTNSSNNLKLPNKLFANFKSMKALSLKLIGSIELREDIFNYNFETLHNLSISGYEGVTLPEKIFDSTRNVKVLQITNNSLESLPSNIFKNLHKLEVLDLSCNKLTNLHL